MSQPSLTTILGMPLGFQYEPDFSGVLRRLRKNYIQLPGSKNGFLYFAGECGPVLSLLYTIDKKSRSIRTTYYLDMDEVRDSTLKIESFMKRWHRDRKKFSGRRYEIIRRLNYMKRDLLLSEHDLFIKAAMIDQSGRTWVHWDIPSTEKERKLYNAFVNALYKLQFMKRGSGGGQRTGSGRKAMPREDAEKLVSLWKIYRQGLREASKDGRKCSAIARRLGISESLFEGFVNQFPSTGKVPVNTLADKLVERQFPNLSGNGKTSKKYRLAMKIKSADQL
jgi:hypothetical protein